MKDLNNYKFIVPRNKEAKKYLLEKLDKKSLIIGDGSPFCGIYYGWLIPNEELVKLNDIKVKIYSISDRFSDIDDFVTSFMDGDIENDDFIFNK